MQLLYQVHPITVDRSNNNICFTLDPVKVATRAPVGAHSSLSFFEPLAQMKERRSVIVYFFTMNLLTLFTVIAETAAPRSAAAETAC